MKTTLHHVSLFTGDLDRSLLLFKDMLGFTELWRAGPLGGKGMAALFGLQDISAELVMLQGGGQVLVELVHVLEPRPEPAPTPPALPSPVSLCLQRDDLDRLHQRLSREGWRPFTPVARMPAPSGEMMRIFCVRTEDNLLLEFIEML